MYFDLYLPSIGVLRKFPVILFRQPFIWLPCTLYAVKSIQTKMASSSTATNERNHHLSEPREATDVGELKLVLVQTFFRHGARTPLKSIPNIEEAFWDQSQWISFDQDHTYIDYKVHALDGGERPPAPIEASYRRLPKLKGGSFRGQLTKLGMNQMYELGQAYRSYYIDRVEHMEKHFVPDHIYIRSTNITRTVQSARCFIAGMYGESLKMGEVAPIKIHTDHAETECLYPNIHSCEPLSHHARALHQSEDILLHASHVRRALQDLLSTSEDPAPHIDFVAIRDDMSARQAHGLPVPDYLETLFEMIDKRAVEMIKALCIGHNQELTDLAGGQVVHMITTNMEEAIRSKSDFKFRVYSCHDTSLMVLLTALEIFDEEWPPLCADLTFELYQDKEGHHFVRTLYIGQEQKLGGGGKYLLPLDEFKRIASRTALSREEFNLKCTATAL